MKRSKKILLIVCITFFGLIALFIGVNMLDEEPRDNVFSLNDLPSPVLDNTNGFFVLWGLGEPEGIDVQSEQYVTEVLRANQKLPKIEQGRTGSEYPPNAAYKSKFARFNKSLARFRFPKDIVDDWITVMAPHAEALGKARQECGIILKRYRLLIDSPVFRDICNVELGAPVPNLLAWLKTANLFVSVQCLDAVNGKWDEAAKNLLDHLDFGKRANAGSRIMINQLIAKAVTLRSLSGLVSMMNHPQCPSSVYEMVLSRMPPMTYEEYGNRNSFIAECLFGISIIDSPGAGELGMEDSILMGLLPPRIFLQENRTKNYFYDLADTLIAYDLQPPYLWKGSPMKEVAKRVQIKKSFWWVRNPIGKLVFSIATPNLGSTIYKSHRLRTYYDMTRILAEFRLKHTHGSDVKATLANLESYKTIDLCSGKPYLYSEDMNCLYSVSIDRKDNGGAYDGRVLLGNDIPLRFGAVQRKPATDKTEDFVKRK